MSSSNKDAQSINLTSTLIFVITLFVINELATNYLITSEDLRWYIKYYYILCIDTVAVICLGIIYKLPRRLLFASTYIILFIILYLYDFDSKNELNLFSAISTPLLYLLMFMILTNMIYSRFTTTFDKVWSIPIFFLSILISVGVTYQIVENTFLLNFVGKNQYIWIIIHLIFLVVSITIATLLSRLILILNKIFVS